MSGSITNKKMTVHYFSPGAEIDGRPLFSYLLIAKLPPIAGAITVNIISTNPLNHPGALPAGRNTITTEDPEEALVGTQARINSHHDGLKAQTGPIEDE